MGKYTIYSINRKGPVFERKITDKTFSTFQEGQLYAIKVAEKLAALHNEKIEMLASSLRFGDREFLVAKVR